MKKIYLAISEKESSGIDNILKKKFPESEVLFLESKERVLEAIKSSFQMIISPIDWIDIGTVESIKPDGTIIILDPSKSGSSVEGDRLFIYDNLDRFRIDILTKDLENGNLQKNKNKSLTKQKIENQNTQKNDLTPEPQESKITETKTESTPKNETSIVIDDKNSSQEEGNTSKPVNLEGYPHKETKVKKEVILGPLERTEEIIQKNYSYDRWDGNKIIGVWSPLPANGVSTFIINLAIFLNKYDLNIAVLETIKTRPVLKSKLTKFKSAPEGWISFFEALYTKDYKPEKVKWVYRGVDWLPLGNNDLKGKKWTSEDISRYMQVLKKCNVGLVDLPSEVMQTYTLQTLEHLDELWIIVDNRYDQTSEWINHIYKTLGNYNLEAKLIVTRCYSFERAERIAEELGFPLLTTLPSLDLEIQINESEDKPLIDHINIKRRLSPSFEKIAEHLLGSHYEKYRPSFWKRMKKLIPMVDSV